MPNDCLKCLIVLQLPGKRLLKESLEGHYEMEVGVAPQTAKFRLNFQIEYFPPRTCFGRECRAAFFEPAAYRRSGRKFHYNTPSNFCQAKCCTNIKKIKIPILCILPIAIQGQMCYNLQCQGEIPLSHICGVGLRLEVAIDPSAHKIAIDESHRNARGCEKISRVFSQKPLDKSPNV